MNSHVKFGVNWSSEFREQSSGNMQRFQAKNNMLWNYISLSLSYNYLFIHLMSNKQKSKLVNKSLKQTLLCLYLEKATTHVCNYLYPKMAICLVRFLQFISVRINFNIHVLIPVTFFMYCISRVWQHNSFPCITLVLIQRPGTADHSVYLKIFM